MSFRLAILFTAFLAGDCLGALRDLPTDHKRFVTARSRSGQFTVQGLPSGRSTVGLFSSPAVTYVRLEPTLLVITAENIKSALLAELHMNDRWEGDIAMSLQPVRRDDEDIVIAAIRAADGWSYRLSVPEQVNKDRFFKAVIEVLLLEISHRGSVERRLELPPWLVPGLAAHVEATTSTPLIMEPESFTTRRRRTRDALRATREALRASGGLTLDDLNWARARVEPALYEASAHLFVRELLRKGGGALFSDMLSRLRDHYNWQSAFLQTFGFRTLRDADKWWTLHLVQFAGSESLSRWSISEVDAQLDSILDTAVQVRLATNELPMTATMPLDRVLQEWEFDRQQPVLRQKLVQLEALRFRAPTNLIMVVSDYQHHLATYMVRRQKIGVRKPATAPAVKTLIADTLQKLNELDVRREIAVGGAPGTAAVKQ